MSGFETLAQVYREIEAPKLKNLKRTGLAVILYSLFFTSLVSFFGVMLIHDAERAKYLDNLIGGLSMFLVGPTVLKLIFHAFVVLVGTLILSRAVNTAIIGSNGVLNRVAEDGVLPDWFRRPHPKFGTTSRLINLVVSSSSWHFFSLNGIRERSSNRRPRSGKNSSLTSSRTFRAKRYVCVRAT